jgi:hypothetical protein
MPPTKGGMTTFMLNLMASPLNEEFEFVPYTVSRPPKNGYGAILRGGIMRALNGILLTIWRLLLFPFFLVFWKIDLVQIRASDYFVFWESVLYTLISRFVRRPVLFRIGGAFDSFHRTSPSMIKRLIGASLRIPQFVIVQLQFARNYVRAAGRTSDMVILPNLT